MSAKGIMPSIPVTVRSKFLATFSNSLDLALLLCSRNIFVCLQVFISSQQTSDCLSAQFPIDDLIILYEIGKIGLGPMNGSDPAVLAK